MKRKSERTCRVEQEEGELRTILAELPENPVPWLSVVRIVAPLIARLAVRYALKRAKRGMSEEKVTAVSEQVTSLISGVVRKGSE